jgi:hypothetical protein
MKMIFIIAAALFFIPAGAFASTRLYLDPPTGEYGPGDSIEVNVKIDVLGDCVNTIAAELEFPKEYLNIREFTTGESILSLWLTKPAQADFSRISQEGKLYFAGGIPGGYCGKIPGDPGESNIVGKIIFTIPTLIISDVKLDEAEIRFTDKTKVLKNDGFGTEEDVLKQSAIFKIGNSPTNGNFDWRSEIDSDKIPPEPFVVELLKDQNVFEGRYYLTFATVDKQTGIDHYEILELRPDDLIGVAPQRTFWEWLMRKDVFAPAWKISAMPYVIVDQKLQSVIKVKALDKAGNERVVDYVPGIKPAASPRKLPVAYIIGTFAIIVLIAAALLVLWLINRKHKKEKISDALENDESDPRTRKE